MTGMIGGLALLALALSTGRACAMLTGEKEPIAM
jgi:hypothetical protein